MSQALYRKWRPAQWDQVVGQDAIIQTLRNAVRAERVAHAYLFAGPRGTGKTSTARLLAKAVNCTEEDLTKRPCDQCPSCTAFNQGRHMDLIEIDAASNTSVEDVRDLRDKINFAPNQGRYKVYIVDEVHMLSTAAFNALLKTLEEPPPHAIFILATTEVHRIPLTVLSRCQRHEFRRIPVQEMVHHLSQNAHQDGIEVEDEALTIIARQATGSLRDAISLLDQLASAGDKITLEYALQVLGTTTSQAVIDLMDAILTRDARRGLELIHSTLDGGADPTQLARQIVEYLRNLLVIKLEGPAARIEATSEVAAEMRRQEPAFEASGLLRTLRAFNSVATAFKGVNWHPALPLELAFAESIQTPEEVSVPAPARQLSQAAQPTPAPVAARMEPIPPARPTAPAPRLLSSVQRVPQIAEPNPVEPAAPARETKPGEQTDSQQAASGANAFQTVVQSWPRIRALIKKHSPQTEGLLNSGRLLGIRDESLVIGLSPVLKGKMENGNGLEITRKAITHVTGLQLEVICSLAGGKANSLPHDVEVDSEGMVGTALRDLGGEVVDVQ